MISVSKDNFLWRVIDYLGVILLLFTSKSLVFYGTSPSFAFFVFFAFSFFLFVFKGRKQMESDFRFTIIYIFILLINVLLINTEIMGNGGMAAVVIAISSFFFWRSYTFIRFREVFLHTLAFLLFFNIIIFIWDEISEFPYAMYIKFNENNDNFERFFLCYYLEKIRLSGIWGEPGVLQIFVNTAFLLYADKLRTWNLSRRELIELVILLIALLCSTSTMGYLVFMAIAYYTIWPSFNKFSPGSKFFLSVLFLIGFASMLGSSAIQDKFSQDIEEERSFGIRLRDNWACFRMAIEEPLWGYGFGTKQYENQSILYRNLCNSNGWMANAARLGIVWLLIYIVYMKKAIRKLPLHMPTNIALFIILLMLANEDFVDYPLTYVYLYYFKSYQSS